MDQGNNEDISTLYLTYDLSTNYIYEEPIKSLQNICIWTTVLNSFESYEALQEIRRMLIDKDQEDTSNLFTIVENDLGIELLPICFITEVKLVIRLVYNEIMRFLETIFLESDKLLFVGNFVFNWQGGIKPRETVLRVLNRNILSTRGCLNFPVNIYLTMI
ncbi:UNVERIFIED_CONTAM: hypothetical protein RMT77_019947 [Armadillidium vulgare]